MEDLQKTLTKSFMDKKLFIDTWGWLILRDKSHEKYSQISAFVKIFLSSGGLLYTTDYVLDETFTLLFKRLPFPKAESSLKLILNSLKAGEFYVEWITPERFIRSWKFRQKLRDKIQISFTDISSIIIMQELGIRQIITENSSFADINLNFELICSYGLGDER